MASSAFKCGFLCDNTCSNFWVPCFLEKLSNDSIEKAIKQDWRRLAFLSPAKRNDWFFVEPALEQTGAAVSWLSDEDTIIKAIKLKFEHGVGVYQLLSDKAKKSKKIALVAVELFGPNLQFADPTVQGDKDIVMKAIAWKGNIIPGSCIKYASAKLQDDQEVVTAAVALDGSNLQYASERLTGDRTLVAAAIASDGTNLQYAAQRIAEEPHMKHDALLNMRNFELAPENYRNHHVSVMAAVKLRGANLKYASDEMKNVEDIVEIAIRQDPSSMQFASEEMQAKLIQQDPSRVKFASGEMQKKLAEPPALPA